MNFMLCKVFAISCFVAAATQADVCQNSMQT